MWIKELEQEARYIPYYVWYSMNKKYQSKLKNIWILEYCDTDHWCLWNGQRKYSKYEIYINFPSWQSGGKESVSPGPVMVSSTRGGKQKESGEMEDGCGLQPPRVTVGVVSSRAPSPGHEIDETTMDYVNKAFSYENWSSNY